MKPISFFISGMILFMAIFLPGCASVDYVGDIYPPTGQVDTFFDTHDIQHPYKVMGKMTLDDSEYADNQAMLAEMKKEAMSRGADAMLFDGVQKIETGVSTTWQDPAKNKGKYPFETGTSTSRIQHEKEMTVSLLKYTDRLMPDIDDQK
mgnify:CR=1 FL=1